jgi:hypothetical protein
MCIISVLDYYFDNILGVFQALIGSRRQRSRLRHCATNWKISGSSPDEVIIFFQYCHEVDSTSKRNEYQESFWG